MPEIRTARCRYCPELLVWCRTVNDKNMPVEADSIDEADLEFDEQGRPMYDRDAGHEPHWANCPGADEARRR